MPHLVSNGALVDRGLPTGRARRGGPVPPPQPRPGAPGPCRPDERLPVDAGRSRTARPPISRRGSRLWPRLEPPDDALLKAVLVKLFVDRQLVVDTTVVDYIAVRIERSLRSGRRGRRRARPGGAEPGPADLAAHCGRGARDRPGATSRKGMSRVTQPSPNVVNTYATTGALPRTARDATVVRGTEVAGGSWSGAMLRPRSDEATAAPKRAAPTSSSTGRRCASFRSASSTASCPGFSSTAASSRRRRTATIRFSSSSASCRSRRTTSTSSSWSASRACAARSVPASRRRRQDGLTPPSSSPGSRRRSRRSPRTSSGAGAS